MAPGFGLGIVPPGGGGVAADVAALVTDYMWKLASAGNLTPVAVGSIADDFHDTWDANADSTELSLAAVGSIAAEGYWDLDGNSDVQPLDV
tara:strand:+ start:680 stop:952 length:273 start_codon:yes stop_codon:yes gene_type:complete